MLSNTVQTDSYCSTQFPRSDSVTGVSVYSGQGTAVSRAWVRRGLVEGGLRAHSIFRYKTVAWSATRAPSRLSQLPSHTSHVHPHNSQGPLSFVQVRIICRADGRPPVPRRRRSSRQSRVDLAEPRRLENSGMGCHRNDISHRDWVRGWWCGRRGRKGCYQDPCWRQGVSARVRNI